MQTEITGELGCQVLISCPCYIAASEAMPRAGPSLLSRSAGGGRGFAGTSLAPADATAVSVHPEQSPRLPCFAYACFGSMQSSLAKLTSVPGRSFGMTRVWTTFRGRDGCLEAGSLFFAAPRSLSFCSVAGGDRLAFYSCAVNVRSWPLRFTTTKPLKLGLGLF